ncbi:hypothetical protein KSP40_PGU019056 [Platanthera guangdongensis]|uniref:Uncharacterized protein n=1 Tax=Platanthera guangdongensis TaxID=2320717 RepID=A0ABR2LJM2_9ASPA
MASSISSLLTTGSSSSSSTLNMHSWIFDNKSRTCSTKFVVGTSALDPVTFTVAFVHRDTGSKTDVLTTNLVEHIRDLLSNIQECISTAETMTVDKLCTRVAPNRALRQSLVWAVRGNQTYDGRPDLTKVVRHSRSSPCGPSPDRLKPLLLLPPPLVASPENLNLLCRLEAHSRL